MQTRYKQGLAAGVAALGLLVAAPALGVAGGSDRSGQPPAGAKGSIATSHFAPVPKQPSASTNGTVAKGRFATVPQQPVNRHPQKASGIKLGKQLRHSKHDKGAKGLKATRDHGTKNLPVQKG